MVRLEKGGAPMVETELESLKKDLAALSKEVADLRAEVTAMGEAFKFVADDTTDHIKVLYGHVHNHLMPVVDKVLPRYAAAKKQIDSFIRRHEGPKGPKKIR